MIRQDIIDWCELQAKREGSFWEIADGMRHPEDKEFWEWWDSLSDLEKENLIGK